MAALRREVLSVYRRILRISLIWEAEGTGNTVAEREYIRNEATSLFRKNREIRDPDEIRMCLAEASSRIEMALHYRNPYPRPVNVPPAFVMASKDKRSVVRRTKQSKPIYIHTKD